MMSRSERLKLTEVRAVFRLLGEVRESGDDWRRWRLHALAGLNRIVGAQVSVAAEFNGLPALNDGRPEYQGDVYLNYDLAYQRAMRDHLASGDFWTDPSTPTVLSLAGRSYTRPREQLAEDRIWYRSPHVNEIRRPSGIDNFLFSHVVLPIPGLSHGICLNRQWGDRSFGERERRLVHLFHRELDRLWRTPPLARDPAADLPPRLRQTLTGLRAGQGEKQIARALGLSRHTVHHYVTDLHRRLDASSLGELLARSTPRLDFRPRLAATPTPTGAGELPT
jgi:hypothetical protein